MQHWVSLTSLRKLRLRLCFGMRDGDVSCLRSLDTLRDLALQDCYSITDLGVQHLGIVDISYDPLFGHVL